ncbi:MAG: InlB B-repeat-containing protein, partial [Planctomycetota bacterium]
RCDVPDDNGFVAITTNTWEGIAITSDTNYNLTINSSPSGMVNLLPAEGTYSHYAGKRVLVNAVRSPDCPAVYDFHHWSGDIPDPCAASQYIIMDSNTTITAHYTRDEAECGDECPRCLRQKPGLLRQYAGLRCICRRMGLYAP